MIALLASIVVLGGLQGDLLPAPQLTRIVVQPDTVWFAGPRYQASSIDTIAYALVRRTGQWLRVGRRSFPPPAKLVPQDLGDTVTLIPGLALGLRKVPGATDTATALQLGVTSTADRVFHPLVPVLTAREAEGLKPAEGHWYGTDMDARTVDLPLAEANGVWAADSDAVWFGLAGGFSEGSGGVGGMLRFDARKRAVGSIWHVGLLQVTVSSLSIAGGGLWVGTVHNGEYGPGGWIGLLRYDLRTGDWLRYQADSTPLPGNAIWETATDGHRVWISTDEGLAEIHLRTGRWRVAFFEAALRGDTIVHDLVRSRPAPIVEKMLALMRRLDPPRRAEFLDAVRKLPPQRFACYMDDLSCQVEALATPALTPFLLESLSGKGADLAALALQRIGDQSVLPALRQALGAVEAYRARVIAVALHQMGDPAGREWIREQLRLRPGDASIGAAAEIRDSASIPRLIQLLPMEYLGNNAMSALVQFQSRSIWRQVAESVLANPAGTGNFLLHARYNAPVADPVFDRALQRILVQALGNSSHHVQAQAALHLVARRDTLGITHLIRLLTEDRMSAYRDKLSALVQATGIDSAPIATTDTAMREARAFWAAWWERSRAGFSFATEQEGEAALLRWRGRWPEEEY
jgi:hypothetical protein